MRLKINLLFILALTLFVTSCNEDGYADYDPGKTAVQELSGEWYVKLLVDGEDAYNIGYYLLSTYNTNANSADEMWIDDDGVWPMKVVTPVNVQALTFSGSDLQGADDISINISDGGIIKDGAVSPSGATTDSIHMNVIFSDDPETEYTIAGYRRTGFLEEE
ncbi:MAG: lipid-binding protein [Salegentibacter sp.]